MVTVDDSLNELILEINTGRFGLIILECPEIG
jgi:hypothetical protein